MRFASVFSGIESASVAWEPLGWEPVAFAEIEPYCASLLAQRYPTTERIRALQSFDVLVGGSPCQDLSMAGKRRGLEGARSSLFFEQVRIFHAARAIHGTRYLLWENVPGAFSLNEGRDFAVVVGALAGTEITAPSDGWGSEGVALGEHGLVEWAVLDAQWFGLAQRRKRVFALLDTGDWQNRAPILLEPDRLRGDSPPGRSAWTGIAARALCSTDGGIDREDRHNLVAEVAPTLQSSHGGDGGARAPGGDFESAEAIVTEVSGTVSSKWAKGTGGPAGDECYNLIAFKPSHSEVGTIDASNAAKQGDRGTRVIGFDCKSAFGTEGDDVAPNMRGLQHEDGNANGGGHLAICWDPAQITSWANRAKVESGGPAPTLHQREPPMMAQGHVRRLTPTECERLQGFPDGWTLVHHNRKPAKDGPRYRALGNSMAVNVMRWIALRISQAESAAPADSSPPAALVSDRAGG